MVELRLMTAAALALVFLLFPLRGAAQLPILAWQHATTPQGDGSRAFLFGRQVFPGPFPFELPVQQPGFDPRSVIATADGAYLVIPTNGGGGSDNLAYMMPPYWARNRGWQVLRVGGGGSVLWSRHIAAMRGTDAPTTPSAAGFHLEPQLRQTQRTADGGVAVLSSAGLHVFDGEGAVRFAGGLGNLCRPAVEDSQGADTHFLTADGVLVLAFGPASNSTARACAFDLDGVELARLESDQPAMQVGDYRAGFGFLVMEGEWNGNVWSSAALALRSSSATLWSMPDMQTHILQPGMQISPSGETWLKLGENFAKIDVAGSIAWQIPLTELPESIPIAWLSGDRLLLASDDNGALRALQADGSSAWSRTLGALTDQGQAAAWEVDAEHIRAFGYRPSSTVGRAVQMRATDGELLGDRQMNWAHEGGHLAFGPFAGDRAIDVAVGVATPGWERPFVLPCDLPGYCPDFARLAKPDVGIYSTASGAIVGSVSDQDFGFPLTAYALERRGGPRPVYLGGDTPVALLAAQYVHDGVRNQVRVERIGRSGNAEWSRSLGFPDYDAGRASYYDNSSGIYVSASTLGPPTVAGMAKMWKLSRVSGQLEWDIDLPFPLQHLRPLWPDNGSFFETCGISEHAPWQLACVSSAGNLTRADAISDVPPNVLLVSAGSIVVEDEVGLRVRVMPSNGDLFVDRFEYGWIDHEAVFRPLLNLQFEAPPPGHELRADAHDALSGVAVAALYGPAGPVFRALSLQVARFDDDGTRLWQSSIDIPMRGFFPDAETTAIARGADGILYVSLNPLSNDGRFPAAVCRLTDLGVLLGCHESPREGRVLNLLTLGGGNGVWAWQRGYLGANRGPLGMYMYRVDAQGFGSALFEVDSHIAARPENFSYDTGTAYFMLSANGADPVGAGADTLLLSLQLGNQLLFADGFEP